ncbi:trypsin-like serine peptidase [Streptomyces yaizuensis]|uniref:Trypsin-like peptidase domain-containing protein n=1 Tax=Streptomyces yaizuensis TaxID=2989713 RepID=A0ABQ5NXK1_9ACTN|nr:trypsin-like peptidase domain-containing protein [Streptomyces sp. YSPA8]GLF95089.1 trypsin-like peptidase domain-containing protein [Streptomyces sp. YSPA8]
MSRTTPSPSRFVIRRIRGRATALAVAGTALALLAPATATAVADQTRAAAADPVSVLNYTAKERKAALAYWTPARIKAVGRSVDLGPTGPKTKPWKGTTLKTVGRLFFVNANGADTWCTATAVKSANKSVVMTAAHCVRRGSAPDMTNVDMVFVPAYHKGKQPYGAFAVRAAATPRSFDTQSVNDMAALTVDADKKGRKLTDVVGATPIAFDRPVGGTIHSFGYPATSPQRGEELLYVTGKAKKERGQQFIPSDMTGGSSGGPWLAGFDTTTGKGTLVSVNSSMDSFTPTKGYGEIFGAIAKKVYDRAQKA